MSLVLSERHRPGSSNQMAAYQITCADRLDAHEHITHVGINGEHGTWTVDYVRRLIRKGSTFFTVSPSTHHRAGVSEYDAVHAGRTIETIRSAREAIPENNLDNLGTCSYQPPS
jgi:hypothetical protein